MFISAPTMFLSLLALTSFVVGGVVSNAARDIGERATGATGLPLESGDANEFLKRGSNIVDVSQVLRHKFAPFEVREIVNEDILPGKRGQ
ncbi:hypothetical protein BS17DRAFT_781061 [Gyrodon lividus]|nr:hypothetical protein BS17DRAFT_781061 [Gyrodon lividus]